MTKPILSAQDKDEIVESYTNKWINQSELADVYNCSQRTVRRALIERGVLASTECKQISVSQEENQVLAEVRKYGLKPGSLTRLMNQPMLTRRNVELYLTNLPATELVTSINSVTAARKIKAERELQEMTRDKGAANG